MVYLEIPGLRGIDDFYIDNQGMDDVGRAFDRRRAKELIVKDLGRFAQDDDISCYVRAPTGVDVRYATGGRLFEDEEAWVNPSIMGSPLVWRHKVLIEGFGSTIRSVAD